MKTFQIFETVSKEYFVEAKSYAEALEKIYSGEVLCDNEEIIDYRLSDTHNGETWEVEK